MHHTAIIIEDEVSAQKHLTNLISKQDIKIEVLDLLFSVSESIKWLATNKHPDLIFMDVHLSDGLSFDILKEINVRSLIVFTTAYDEYALKAFKTNSIDYLLKPITAEDLKVAVTKYIRYSDNETTYRDIKNIELFHQLKNTEKLDYKNRFLLKKGKSVIPVKTNDIAYFYRDDLVFAKSYGDTSYIIDSSLNELQKTLDPNIFLRVNRQLLVNIEAIKKMTPYKPGQLQILLHPEYHEFIYLSQERSSWIKSLLST